MPPLSSRMTKQPLRPARYFPGKQYDTKAVSDDEDSEEGEEEEETRPTSRAPPPKASSFPSHEKLVSHGTRPGVPALASAQQPHYDLSGFETASESSEDENNPDEGSDKESRRDGGSKSSSDEDTEDDSSEEEDSSDEEETKRPMIAPKFISKAQRALQARLPISSVQQAEDEERRKREEVDRLLEAQLKQDAAARAAGRRYWDDDMPVDDDCDDRDGVDAEGEKAAWKLRELRRVQRDRAALVEREKEREEVERRRDLTAEERAAEDKAYLDEQEEERGERGKSSYMQRYHHKGAFFAGEEQDEEVKAALNRSFAGARFQDDVGDKSMLPEYMRIRDMTKLGRKGKTKYKDLKSEDTGRWGDEQDKRSRPDDVRQGENGRTGANLAPMGERRRWTDEGEAGGDLKRARYG